MSIHAVMLRARITLFMPPPHTEISRMAKSRLGKAVMMSMTREMTQSTDPPLYPASPPSGTPISTANPITESPTIMDVRAP